MHSLSRQEGITRSKVGSGQMRKKQNPIELKLKYKVLLLSEQDMNIADPPFISLSQPQFHDSVLPPFLPSLQAATTMMMMMVIRLGDGEVESSGLIA